MPAYVVVDIEITDPEVYEEVKRLPPQIFCLGTHNSMLKDAQ